MTKKQLKKWRTSKKLTQEAAALKIGVSVGGWRNWEYGRRDIPKWLVILIELSR